MGLDVCWSVDSNAPLQLLRRYDFALVDPTQPVKLFSAAVWLAHDLWVKITRRDPNNTQRSYDHEHDRGAFRR